MKTVNSVKSAITCSYHLNKLLSASAWSSSSYLIIYAKELPHGLTLNMVLFSSSRKQFPITRNKTIYFHMHISISEYGIPLCCRYQGIISSTCKEYSKDMQFLETSPTASHLTIIKKTSTNQILDGRNCFQSC